MIDHSSELAADWARLGPFSALDKLGLKHRRAGREAFICCPWHAEKTPSCTVAIGSAGTLRVHCFACDETWDVHSLVGQLHGIDTRSSFRDVLRTEAEMLGRWDIVDAIEGKSEPREPTPRPAPKPLPPPEPERTYPDREELSAFLGECVRTALDREVSEWLRSRWLDPLAVDVRGLAYALPKSAELPRWARYQRKTWIELGHRLIVPLYNHEGVVTSVRAGRVCDGDTPKRLPPSGHKVSGLVMADAVGVELLRTGQWPAWGTEEPRVVIAEGEPDWMSAAIRWSGPNNAVLGIYSGAWTPDVARRIPDGAKVAVWTDRDPAGEKYAWTIAASLSSRCTVIRGAA